MKILITGAAGFIGSRIAEAHLGHGNEVVGIDNLSTGRKENFPRNGRLFVGDIRDPEIVAMTGDADVIYHCAASYADRSDWERDASTNVDGTIHVIRHAQATGAKIVYFQTSLCYGRPRSATPLLVTDELRPEGSYAVSKTAGECYIRDSGVPYVSLRLANIYGPRNLSGPIPTFWKRLSEGKPITVVDSRRDFVYVDDLVWVAVNAAREGAGPYHVSSGIDYSIYDLYAAVCAAMDRPIEDVPITPRGPDDVATLLLDPTETERAFGWTAQTDLGVGIARAVRWYEEWGVEKTFTHLAGR